MGEVGEAYIWEHPRTRERESARERKQENERAPHTQAPTHNLIST